MTDTPAAAGTPDWVARYEISARPDHQECARDYHILESQLSACRAELARMAKTAADNFESAESAIAAKEESERLLVEAAKDADDERYEAGRKFAKMRDWYEAQLKALTDPLIWQKMLEPSPPIFLNNNSSADPK